MTDIDDIIALRHEITELEADRKRLGKARETLKRLIAAGIEERNKIRRNLAGTGIKTEKIDFMVDTWQDILDLINEPLEQENADPRP